jgi:hypothetical protein
MLAPIGRALVVVGVTVVPPLGTSLLLSIVLTVLLNLLLWKG